jgi:hypothetical protein
MRDWHLCVLFGILVYVGMSLILTPNEVIRFLAPIFEFFGY